ncbi:MAG: hypothetical protein C4538_12095 [Nitrospiraceae bacterium]|nr:MAG: hypothetical protein C4538_12095 [Nitrospiraceae bacterium]
MSDKLLNIYMEIKMKKSRANIGCDFISLYFFLCFMFLWTVSLQAAVMPDYSRLQPVTENLTAPTAAALDIYENLYVTESIENRLLIYSQSGHLLKLLYGLNVPLGVAVDESGRIFVGNQGNGNVEAYDSNLHKLFKLGSGDGEFKQPIAIATSKAGEIYVVDSDQDLIKVFNSDGSFKYSFGGSGSSNGQFTFPTSISIHETSGEIIVVDRQLRQSGTEMSHGARVQVFDLNGIYKRSFGEYGIGAGKLSRPVGVIKDEVGRIYVSDAYQQVVRVFDENGLYIGSIYGTENPLRTPLGLVRGKSNRLFIASLNTKSVEVYGLDAYTQMEVTPSVLSFDGFTNGNNPDSKVVEIKNTGNSVLSWSASAQDSWITLSESAGSIAQSESHAMQVGVNLEGLSEGIYEGTVVINAESGGTEIIDITLNVVRPPTPVLSVTPVSLEFTSLNGAQPSSQSISVINAGDGILNWTASSDRAWITLNKYAGTAQDSISVSADITSMTQGTYTGTITIEGQGTTSDTRAVSVSLSVTEAKGAINVLTNIKAATFIINGTASYSGSGKNWQVNDAPAGTYVVVFGDVAGYEQPVSQGLTLEKDSSISFTGEYIKEASNNQSGYFKQIIVGKGPGLEDNGLVKGYNPNGTSTGVEFIAHQYPYGVNVATGDVNCDGYDEIITAPGPGPSNPAEIRIFDRKGHELSQLKTTAFDYKYGANVTSCDFDRDGHSEVVVGSGVNNPAEVKIFAYDTAQDKLVDSGISLLAFETNNGVRVATTDIDCDEMSELVTMSGTGKGNKSIKGWIRIWKVNTEKGVGQWSVSLVKEFPVESRYVNSNSLASADINGDYFDEIIIGTGPRYKKSFDIQVVNGDAETISIFNAGVAGNYGANLASGDLDGDGVAEIIAGMGSGMNNEAVVKIFDAYGIQKSSFTVFNSKYGVNVAVGNPGIGE